MHTLLMLSGGVDSLYALHQFLTTTDDELWVHHVHLLNREGRHLVEARACADIVAWCTARCRPFRYTESSIDHRAFALHGRDVLLVGFEAGVIAQNAHAEGARLDRWVLGYCLEEAEEVVAGQPVAHSNRRRVLETCVQVSAHPLAAPPLFGPPLISKQAELEALPRDLAALAWTCRTPVVEADHSAECGVCKTCVLMHPIRAQLGMEPRKVQVR